MTPQQRRRIDRLAKEQLPCMGCLKTELQHAEWVAAGGLERLSAMLEEIKRQRVLDQGAEARPRKSWIARPCRRCQTRRRLGNKKFIG